MQVSPKTERARRLAEDPIPSLLIRLALPAMVGMMVQSAYYFIDRVFVGKALDLDAVAGITIAFPYMLVLQAASMLIGIGAAARVSIKLGEKKNDEAELILGNATTMLIAASVVMTAAGAILLPHLLQLMPVSHDAVRDYALEYLQVIVYATGFQLVGYGLNSIIRAEGNTRTAMWTLLIGVFLNIGLAPLFLFVFHWGMRGAALATAISQGVSLAWVLAYFLRGHSLLRFHVRLLRLSGAVCGRILLFGLPMFVMMVFASLMLYFLNRQAGLYGGDVAVAAWGGIFSLLQLANNPVYGINQGTQPIIGFNHGARRFDRVKQALLTGILFASTLTIAGFLIAMIFPGPVLNLFINREKIDPSLVDQLLDIGTHAMRICFLMSPLVGFQAISASYFQVVGKPREATLLMLSRQVLLLIPLVLILPRFFGLDGVWMALPISDFVSSMLTGACLFYELRHLDSRHQEATAESAREMEAAANDIPAAAANIAMPEDVM